MQDRTSSSQSLTERLDRLARVAGLALSWERLWPPLLALGVLVALFLTVSWLGLWLHLPRWGRIAGLIVFAATVAWPLFLFLRIKLPSRAEALDRVDRDSGLPHRPAATLDDQLANASADPATIALWRIHLQRAAQLATQLKIAAPSPGIPKFDRYAVRGGALLALCAAAFVAGPEKYPRVIAAFDFSAAGSISQGYRLDAWIDPPAYTGRAPQVLRLQDENGARPGSQAQKIQAPSGSSVILRASEGAGVTAEVKGGIVDQAEDAKDKPKDDKPAPRAADSKRSDQEQRWVLRADGTLTLRRLGSVIATFDISSIADKPPVISLKGEPKNNVRGSLTLAYKIEDDYGVVGAEAEFSKPSLRGKPVTGRMLAEAPKMPLSLAQGPGGLGDGETTGDLSEHPWAGAQVTMILTARDEAGNIGRSEPQQITLPQRTFVKPLARALVEQRRNLVFDPDNRRRIGTAMEALMIDPDRFQTGASAYLGLQAIMKRLQAARTDDHLRETADLMWEMALRLEEGDLTGAERDLRAAQQALRDAMNRGASDEELRKLMDQLRAALDKFMQELAERQMREGQQDQQAENQPNDPNQRFITPQDLRSMLDRMENMARNGNMADAQRMLDQLQNMLENLQTARRQQNQQNSQQREMNRALNQLDQMMRDQQELRDDTYGESQGRPPRQRAQRNQRQQRGEGQQQRGQRQPGQPGQQQPGEDGDDDQDSADNQQGQQGLQQRQEALRRQLQELQRRMREMGLPPEQGFADAEGEMGEAEKQLGEGTGEGQGRAVGPQGKALESLRRGAQSLAQQMQQQPGGQPGDQAGGPGEPNGPGQRGRDAARPDPLGRESRDRNDNSRSRYDPLGVPAAQRAQQVLEELRRRLGDQTRPREELDYLERLLRRY